MDLGIMQGRLSPPTDGRFQFFPRHTWEDEFPLALQAGLGAIEWIYDQYGAGANPIETDEGIARIHELAQQSGIEVRSICADWFMEELLIGGSHEDRRQARERLDWLIGRAEALGATRIVLPFVDASALSTPMLVSQAVEAVEGALAHASVARVELHLETSLDPAAFAALLSSLPDPLVKVNYDIGNS
jgi:L-ribulose-5-phosphate 3-epimerase